MVREKFFDNWDGDYYYVLSVYAITSYIMSFWGCAELIGRPRKEPVIILSQLSLTPIMLVLLLFMEYVGIFLFTGGFKVIPLFENDIDAARGELNAVRGAGAGIGAILIYCGVLCIYHTLSCKWSAILKVFIFVLAYIPFLLYGGRLLMILPILVMIMILIIKKKASINKKLMLKLAIGFVLLFGGTMYFGTMRANRKLDMDLFLAFLTADLFPEFRGSVAAFPLNKLDLGWEYVSMIFSRMFPGSIAEGLGIDKVHQINIGPYVAKLLGYDGIGIRISITGELLLTNIISYMVYWLVILFFLHLINERYYKNNCWGKDKCIYMYIGLFTSLIIPYGISLIPNLIITTLVLLILKTIVYSRTNISVRKICHIKKLNKY